MELVAAGGESLVLRENIGKVTSFALGVVWSEASRIRREGRRHCIEPQPTQLPGLHGSASPEMFLPLLWQALGLFPPVESGHATDLTDEGPLDMGVVLLKSSTTDDGAGHEKSKKSSNGGGGEASESEQGWSSQGVVAKEQSTLLGTSRAKHR